MYSPIRTLALVITFASSVCSQGSDDSLYEIWASDQSNSVANQTKLGVKGSFLWIFDSDGMKNQLSGLGDAKSLSCIPGKDVGPCDILDVFPQDLEEVKADGSPTGKKLKDLDSFCRLHAVVKDPFNRYVHANIFTPGGGYSGIIDTETKEAVALFRHSKFNTGKARSVHMAAWSADGSAILIANLHGKAVERVNVGRDSDSRILSVEFDRNATIGFGSNMAIEEGASFFRGNNAFGRPLKGAIVGDYANADLGDLTPNGYCKEDGCGSSALPSTGRVNNVPISPISSVEDNLYMNFGGGGIFILDLKATPMAIMGEYGSEIFNGAGVVGIQVGKQMFMNAGVSAGSSGFKQSTFSVYSFNSSAFSDGPTKPNVPLPNVVFKDNANTNTIGNVDGNGGTINDSGQLPGVTTRRDSHGVAATVDGKYLHVVDRIQNVVESFDVETYERTTYDLTSLDGRSGRPNIPNQAGACLARSVTDDGNLNLNDPSPDFIDITPDGRYLVVALRGPAPVTVGHSAQGSCPGVGIVEVTENGKAGKLVDVLRTTNTIDNAPVPFPVSGGIDYVGAERSDVHGAIAIAKVRPKSTTERELSPKASSASRLNLGYVSAIIFAVLLV